VQALLPSRASYTSMDGRSRNLQRPFASRSGGRFFHFTAARADVCCGALARFTSTTTRPGATALSHFEVTEATRE
jgi:hypothetical protein